MKVTGCHGFCEKGPVVVILPSKVFYPSVKVEDVPRIVEKTVLGGEVIEELLYVDPATGQRIVYDHEVPFYAQQQRLVFRLNGTAGPDRPGGLHRPRRLPGHGQGALRDDPRAGHRRGARGGPAGPRRRGLPHRA